MLCLEVPHFFLGGRGVAPGCIMRAQGEKGRPSDQTFDFFGGANASVNWMPDPDDATRQVPAPTREYPPIDYWRVQEHE